MAERAFSITGATFSGNHGAEAMLSATIGRVRERVPSAAFTVFSYYPADDRRLVRDQRVCIADGRPQALLLAHLPFALLVALARGLGARVPDGWLPDGVARLRRSDALLDAQGISFDDGRLLVLPYKILAIWPAILMGVPVVKLSQAMGPFRNPVNRLSARLLLRRCRRVFARGRITADMIRELGVSPAPVDTAADLAFSFAPGDALTAVNADAVERLERGLRARRASGTTVVALSPSAVVQSRMQRRGMDYLALLTSLVDAATRDGRHVVVVPNATRAHTASTRNNDLPLVAALRAQVQASLPANQTAQVTWVDFDLSFEGIRRIMAVADVLIASRFHAMVAGLGLAIPVLVIGWSHKYTEVLMDFGCEEFAIDYGEATTRARDLLDELLDRRAEVQERLAQRLPAVVASSRRQFDIPELQ